MRILIGILALALSMTAVGQEKKGPGGPPKNLKVLPADANVIQIMRGFNASLGVMCTYCHVQGDFPSDDNPKKDIGRAMLRMVGDINGRFPDGKQHVGCWTCHRGKAAPEINPPTPEAPKP